MQDRFKLDIDCPHGPKEGFLGFGLHQGLHYQTDVQTYPWPFQDECVLEANCENLLHRVRDLVGFLDELWRVLVPGGKTFVRVPHHASVRAWQDPFTVRAVPESTFLFFNKVWREEQKVSYYPIKADFRFTHGYAVTTDWAIRSQEARDFALRHYNNVATDLQLTLEKV